MHKISDYLPLGFAIKSSKTFVHSLGLSAAFRQWKAESHCRFIHGYSLQVYLEFEATGGELDCRNWVVDFGSLKSLKGWLEDIFDHKYLAAEDDPAMPALETLEKAGLIQLRVLPAVGCEAFAILIAQYVETWLQDNGYSPRCRLSKVEVKEHEANGAIVERI